MINIQNLQNSIDFNDIELYFKSNGIVYKPPTQIQYYMNLHPNITKISEPFESDPFEPATTSYGSCYSNMFNRCTSLTSAPELPVTTLDGPANIPDYFTQIFSHIFCTIDPIKYPIETIFAYVDNKLTCENQTFYLTFYNFNQIVRHLHPDKDEIFISFFDKYFKTFYIDFNAANQYLELLRTLKGLYIYKKHPNACKLLKKLISFILLKTNNKFKSRYIIDDVELLNPEIKLDKNTLLINEIFDCCNNHNEILTAIIDMNLLTLLLDNISLAQLSELSEKKELDNYTLEYINIVKENRIHRLNHFKTKFIVNNAN